MYIAESRIKSKNVASKTGVQAEIWNLYSFGENKTRIQ